MLNSFLKQIEIWRNQRHVKRERQLHLSCVTLLEREKNYKKFSVSFRGLVIRLNDLFYDDKRMINQQREFVKLMVLRIRDLYECILYELFWFQRSYSVYPLMRSLCESLFLLKYVQGNPTYISEIMSTEGRGLHISKLKDKVSDQELNDYYSWLSNLMHVNPSGIKCTYYRSKLYEREKMSDMETIITQIPINFEDFRIKFVISLMSIMIESVQILEGIYNDIS